MNKFYLLLFSLFSLNTVFSQITNSTRFSISASELLFTKGAADSKELIDGDAALKFVYDKKKSQVYVKSVNSLNFSINYDKTFNIDKKINVPMSDWIFHVKDYTYLVFCDKDSQESFKSSYAYYRFNRSTGELIGPIMEHVVEKGFNDFSLDMYKHHISRDSSFIVRETGNTKGKIVNTTIEIIDTELNVLNTKKYGELNPVNGVVIEQTSLNKQIRVSNAGDVAILESFSYYEKSVRIHKNILYQLHASGEGYSKLIGFDFDAMGSDFFYDNNNKLRFVGVFGSINGSRAKGYFSVTLDGEGDVLESWKTDFDENFITDYESSDIVKWEERESHDKLHINNWQMTKTEILPNGNFLFVAEKIFVKQKDRHPRRHNHNVFVSIVSPEGKIISSVKVPKFVYNSNYGRGTLNSEVLVDDKYAYVFTEESEKSTFPTNTSQSISLTNSYENPYFVCYKVDLSDGSMIRYQLFWLRGHELRLHYMPKNFRLNSEGKLYCITFIPKKKGSLMLKIQLD